MLTEFPVEDLTKMAEDFGAGNGTAGTFGTISTSLLNGESAFRMPKH
jgi:hypothetical protein